MLILYLALISIMGAKIVMIFIMALINVMAFWHQINIVMALIRPSRQNRHGKLPLLVLRAIEYRQ